MTELIQVAFGGALPFIVLSIFLAFDVYETRRHLNAVTFERDALRSHLTVEMEDHAKTRGQFDQLARLTSRLVIASEALCDTPTTVIMPPSGGMVA